MTRIPESKEFILKRVCRVPVQVPASMPAPNAASEASGGLTPWTSSVAATEAPRVMEPSAVMSGKAKMWSDWTGRSSRGYPSNKGERARVETFSGKRKPYANIRILERDAFRGGGTTKRGADEAGRLGNHHQANN